MDIRALTPTYAVSPQIDPEDVPGIAAAGYRTILCNRPDMEVPPSHQAAALRAATEAAGLVFVDNPFTNGMLTEDIVALQARTMGEETGPVLAYCASGTRSTILWLLAETVAGGDVDALLDAAARGGYQLQGMRPQLEALKAR
jgi:uncharacterized protein (TIGR01244 family)